jgi:hypothetical protein
MPRGIPGKVWGPLVEAVDELDETAEGLERAAVTAGWNGRLSLRDDLVSKAAGIRMAACFLREDVLASILGTNGHEGAVA